MRPRVLVLLAAHDGEPWLQPQLQSIFEQQEVQVHVLVGDDASRDDTAKRLAAIHERDPRLEVKRWETPSGSAGASFRRLFRAAEVDEYDYVALSDQDDLWDRSKLSAAIAALKISGAHGYSCGVVAFGGSNRGKDVLQNARTRAADFLFEGAGQGCTFVLSVEFFRRVQSFCVECAPVADALHYHDWLVYLLARSWTLQWYFDRRTWMRYRQHGGNEIGARGGMRAFASRLERIRSGWYRRQIQAALEASRAAGSQSVEIRSFEAIFARQPSVSRRIALARFVLRHGRRRLGDRLVLVGAAAAGWI